MKNNHLWIPIVLIFLIIGVFVLVAICPASASAEGKVKGDYPTVQEVLDAYEEEEEVAYYDLIDDLDDAGQEYDHELVMKIQQKLNENLKGVSGFKKLEVDGIFGPATGNAVKLFQYRKGLAIDGKCGPDTLGRLTLSSKGVSAWPHYSPSIEEELNKSTNGFGACVYLESNMAAFFRQARKNAARSTTRGKRCDRLRVGEQCLVMVSGDQPLHPVRTGPGTG